MTTLPDSRTDARPAHADPDASAPVRLVLEDGWVMCGQAFGARRAVVGEVVFTTGMTGTSRP